MTVTLFADDLKTFRPLGLFQLAAGFGAPAFSQDRGRLVRFSVQTLKHWRQRGERGIGRNMDSYGPLWHGFHLGKCFDFRHYSGTATHISFGPFTLSYVRGTWGPTAHRISVTLEVVQA
jgi:hypothetical protein